MLLQSLVYAFFLVQTSHSAASIAPPDGKVFLAAWLDSTDLPNLPNSGDRPQKFNSRLGINASAFQYAENIPNLAHPQYMADQLDLLTDNAILYITVYPMDAGDGTSAALKGLNSNPWPISDQDITYLAGNCSELNKKGRRVLMRLAPEMNGYGQVCLMMMIGFVIVMLTLSYVCIYVS